MHDEDVSINKLKLLRSGSVYNVFQDEEKHIIMKKLVKENNNRRSVFKNELAILELLKNEKGSMFSRIVDRDEDSFSIEYIPHMEISPEECCKKIVGKNKLIEKLAEVLGTFSSMSNEEIGKKNSFSKDKMRLNYLKVVIKNILRNNVQRRAGYTLLSLRYFFSQWLIKRTNYQCLVHNDAHYGNVLIHKNEKEITLIDYDRCVISKKNVIRDILNLCQTNELPLEWCWQYAFIRFYIHTCKQLNTDVYDKIVLELRDFRIIRWCMWYQLSLNIYNGKRINVRKYITFLNNKYEFLKWHKQLLSKVGIE